MKARRIILVYLFLLIANGVNAQNSETDSFKEFRKNILNQYQGFRQSVLDNYSRYLDGVWKDFYSFKGFERDHSPKPNTAPRVEKQPGIPMDLSAPVEPYCPEPEKHIKEKIPPKTFSPTRPVNEMNTIQFYGMIFQVPSLDIPFDDLNATETLGKKWELLQNLKIEETIWQLKNITSSHRLNDWFCFQFVRDYVNTICKHEEINTRTFIAHFILANWGFDVRLARIETELCLLIPVRQQIYSRSFLLINGQKYYLFSVDNDDIKSEQHVSICTIPENVECGEVMDFVCHQGLMTSSDKLKKRVLTDGCISITANVDVTIMEMVRYYPQMEINAFAKSVLMPDLRKDIIEQIKPQIQGLSQLEAANKLLRFVQFAFDYSTDVEQHGYEKPYFLEENFYYLKNDCEDRAIFYAFLIYNLLHLDIHLVHFSGHECTAICFTDDIKGDCYTYDDRKYFICDPTYIGSTVGMCMDRYKKSKPEIERWIK